MTATAYVSAYGRVRVLAQQGSFVIDAIVMTPAEGTLRIELKGSLAAMLGATVQSKRAPETKTLSLQVSMVAGARNRRYLQLWSGAA